MGGHFQPGTYGACQPETTDRTGGALDSTWRSRAAAFCDNYGVHIRLSFATRPWQTPIDDRSLWSTGFPAQGHPQRALTHTVIGLTRVVEITKTSGGYCQRGMPVLRAVTVTGLPGIPSFLVPGTALAHTLERSFSRLAGSYGSFVR
jgi:hypothetical protein